MDTKLETTYSKNVVYVGSTLLGGLLGLMISLPYAFFYVFGFLGFFGFIGNALIGIILGIINAYLVNKVLDKVVEGKIKKSRNRILYQIANWIFIASTVLYSLFLYFFYQSYMNIFHAFALAALPALVAMVISSIGNYFVIRPYVLPEKFKRADTK